MKISIESPTRIKMIPETEHEKTSLEALWKIIIRCNEDSKVLCPIGAYIASEDEGASFSFTVICASSKLCSCLCIDIRGK
jgi:hypothetical protein